MRKLLFAIFILCFSVVHHARADALDNWTPVVQTSNQIFTQIFCANGMFVATSYTKGTSFENWIGSNFTSADGLHWASQRVTDRSSGLAFGNGVFVRSQDNGDGGQTYDAINPAMLTNAADQTLTNFIFDGMPFPDFPTLNGVTFGTNSKGQGIFVTVGHDYEDYKDFIATSTNGHDWVSQTSPVPDEFLTGVTYNSAASSVRFLAIGYNPYIGLDDPGPQRASLLRSSDGVTWRSSDTNVSGIMLQRSDAYPPALAGNPIIYCVKGTCYVADVASNAWYAPADSLAFKFTNAPYPSIWIPAGSPTGTYVSANGGSNIYTSSDAFNWTLRNTGLTNAIASITFGGNHFLMATSDGVILQSGSIAPQMTAGIDTATGSLKIQLGAGLFATATIQASTNLSTWTNLVTLTNSSGTVQFLDTTATNYMKRFYRAMSD